MLAFLFVCNFVLSFQVFMETHIYISDDVMNNVVRPISLFLNDVPAGTVLSIVPPKAGIFDMVPSKVAGNDDLLPTFEYSSNQGGKYKFTTYDLKNFSCKGKSFKEYTALGLDKCAIQQQFKVLSCKPLLVDNKKVYPLFAYKGIDAYTEARKALAPGAYPTEEMLEKLKASGVKETSLDKYYRVIETDLPVLYSSSALTEQEPAPKAPRAPRPRAGKGS